jgi:hypothetical protein
MTRSRVEQRDHLMTSLGMLADPIRRLIDGGEALKHTAPYVEAQFRNDLRLFTDQLKAFCRIGPIRFESELGNAVGPCNSLIDFIGLCRNPQPDYAKITERFKERLESARKAIRAIPCEDPSTILPSESPFQTYLRLRAICAGAGARLDLLDPWLSAEVFHRYLADVPPAVKVQVVTGQTVMHDPRHHARRDQIVAVSELVALERKDKYRFLVSSQQHDRHCRADDQILHVGGSLVHASMRSPYTLSQLDPAQSNHAFLDGIIGGAVEWYGPATPNHRRS